MSLCPHNWNIAHSFLERVYLTGGKHFVVETHWCPGPTLTKPKTNRGQYDRRR
jgi:hypothetical protein